MGVQGMFFNKGGQRFLPENVEPKSTAFKPSTFTTRPRLPPHLMTFIKITPQIYFDLPLFIRFFRNFPPPHLFYPLFI